MDATVLPSFGQNLKYWRKRRGLSQLQLANEAQTTPRHISFIETGRSRPGRDLILRLSRTLDLLARDTNALLAAAGFSPAFQQRRLDEEAMRPFAAIILGLLDSHDPYPASAFDLFGRIHMSNAAHRRLFPGASERSPEEAIDHFYGHRAGLDFENWPEVAWAYADRWRLEASRSGSSELARLAERAEAHLVGVPRPSPSEGDSAVLSPRIRIGGETYSTFSTVLRFDTARELTLSEIRVELVFPANEKTAKLFRLFHHSPETRLTRC
jgi:transcriptional regulator with XRE-family HTH domain